MEELNNVIVFLIVKKLDWDKNKSVIRNGRIFVFILIIIRICYY